MYTTYEIMMAKKQFETCKQGLLVRAPAKINLSLLIAGKRRDGFHNLETIMAKINWYDEIIIHRRKEPGIELVCKGPYWAPQGRENLVYRACEKLLESCGKKTGVKVTLKKNIPAGTGLGSASSDAAATLMGLKKLLGLKVSPAKLKRIALELGSDVPFFLEGPLSFCKGKGEKIKKISKKFNFAAILIIPDVSSSTKAVYANYRHEIAVYRRLGREINSLLAKNRIALIAEICANMLQKSCFELYKGLSALKTAVESLGFGPLCLSGSGSAMFFMLPRGDSKKFFSFKRKIKQQIGCNCVIVRNSRW